VDYVDLSRNAIKNSIWATFTSHSCVHLFLFLMLPCCVCVCACAHVSAIHFMCVVCVYLCAYFDLFCNLFIVTVYFILYELPSGIINDDDDTKIIK